MEAAEAAEAVEAEEASEAEANVRMTVGDRLLWFSTKADVVVPLATCWLLLLLILFTDLLELLVDCWLQLAAAAEMPHPRTEKKESISSYSQKGWNYFRRSI